MASSIAQEARRTPGWFDGLPAALESALRNYDMHGRGDLKEIESLATQVTVGGYSVHAEFSMVSDECWIAPGTLYATFVYEPESNDKTEFTETFPMRVYYTVNDGKVAIQRVKVDASSLDE
ncbi:MAG: hypothetical protein QOJ94_1129 [Sphingomonadales bacterium]|nr:hypothetical protein [Sphingomonadales bacterium]